MQKLSRRIGRVLISRKVRPYLKWKRRLGDERPEYKMTAQNQLECFVREVEKPKGGKKQ